MSTRDPWRSRPPERVEARIVVERDGSVTARSGKVEYGQGIRTGFALIVAQELDVPSDRVRVVLGETDVVPWDMGTFGSMSTATDGASLRAAAAFARSLLLERASRRLDVPVEQLEVADGRIAAADGRSLSYQELAAGDPLRGLVPEGAPAARAPAEHEPRRLEAVDIVTGAARYPADVRLPGMLRGHAVHAPGPGARLVSLEDREARGLPGVVSIVREPDFAGVVAERDEQALAAVRALHAEWATGDVARGDSVDMVLRDDAGATAAFDAGALRLDAHYHVPHIAHASIGPSAAVADVRADGADLYVATQRPFGLRDAVAEQLGLPPESVHVHPQVMGGMYGRGNMADAALDAVRLSRAAGRPVLVQWTRAEEFQLSPHRPVLDADIAAALDADGALVAWRYDVRTNPHTYGGGPVPPFVVERTSGRNAVPPYRLGAAQIALHVMPGAVRTGAFRSLAAAPNTFATECFLDELAHASHQDPIAFRLRHTDDARLRRVLETVRERSDWIRHSSEDGHGMGVACAIYHGTYVAEVAEVTVDAASRVRLLRVWCAVDPGRVVHADGARNQIEGGIQQAASWTLLEELHHRDDRVTTGSWRDYPIASARDAPEDIDVVFTAQHDAASTGIGEPGSVPTAAAIANAVFQACGARVRRLPLSPAHIRRA
jgi:CO/xanthine dehydrogenase Mo-binding subunit